MNYDIQRLTVGSNPTLLARIADEDGNLFTARDFVYITGNIRHRATGKTPIGFDDFDIPLSSVLPSLEKTEAWYKDNDGYNFRYRLSGTATAPALPWPGEYYVHLTFIRATAPPFVLRYECEVQ